MTAPSGLTLSTSELEFHRTRSQFAEALIQWEDEPFSLRDYPMFRAIYDGSPEKMLLKTCRQVGKSMTLSSFSIAESAVIPHFATFFIAPTKEQTLTFSTSRVGKMIQFSPIVRDLFVNASTEERVLARHFSHGSKIVFSYASDNADRCRGQSCDRLMVDEIQDVLLEVVRPVVVECLRQSKRGPFETYCGTPKTMENGIETLWEASSQTEWVIKCSGCGKHSCIVSEKQLGKMGPICKCGKYLNPREGFWFNMNQRADVEMRGFHISRPMMPTDVPICWNAGTKEYERAVKKWRSILSSLSGPTAVPISMFRNEILGVSDSAGRRLVTKEILNRMRTGPAICAKPTRENRTSVTKVIAGIDWSGGGDGLKSRTVLTILGKMGLGKTRLLYYKIFPGTSPVEEIEEIISVLQEYDRITDHTMIIGADAGEGNMSVDILRNRLPNPRRIVKFRYSGNYGGYIGWHPKTSTFVVNRTAAIDSLMMSFINSEFEFPKEPEDVMKPAFNDILAVYEEESGQGDVRRKVWRHKKPDDFLHALNFGRLAMQISIGEIDMTSKIIYDDSELDAIGPAA